MGRDFLPTYLVSFDPGNTTGYAEFNEGGDCIVYGQLKFDDLVDYCNNLEDVKVIVCEDFKIRGPKAKSFIGSRLETVQAVGVIRAAAQRIQAEFVLQDASIKPTAQKWTQLRPVGAHSNSHWVDAFSHGAYWLIKNGKRKTELQKEHDGL